MTGSTRRRRGTAMVEMAVVLPLLLLVIFAIFETSIAFYRWLNVNSAAREGARVATLDRLTCNPTLVRSEVDQVVARVLGAAGLAADRLDAQGLCQPSLPGNPAFTDVRVVVEHELAVLPSFGRWFGGSLGPTLDLSGRSLMRNP